MSDETRETEDVTVDEKGAIVNSIDYLVVDTREKEAERKKLAEAWWKKEERKRGRSS